MNRLSSIDILRAVTMVLMIFVNDLWSLTGIPLWLEHVKPGVDGIGLADVVFPAFLFIVGLSIPFAIQNRRNKGDSQWQIIQHVLLRALALLVMGVFLVNGESINESATGIHRLVWNTLCCTCFILLWNNYKKTIKSSNSDSLSLSRSHFLEHRNRAKSGSCNQATWNIILVLKVISVSTLLTLAYMYRGGEGQVLFGPQWWGILGLIGWAYLAAGSIAVIARQSLVVNIAGWILFCVLSICWHSGIIPSTFHFIPEAILGGTFPALVSGGICVSLLVQHFRADNQHMKLIATLAVTSLALIGLSIITRPYYGLSKLGATPAWLFLCTAFTIIGFIVIYLVADVAGKSNWFNFIKPAGTDTLLCYLIPYFAYAFTGIPGIDVPMFLLEGWAGLLKSFLFALLCVAITGLLTRAGVRLKL